MWDINANSCPTCTNGYTLLPPFCGTGLITSLRPLWKISYARSSPSSLPHQFQSSLTGTPSAAVPSTCTATPASTVVVPRSNKNKWTARYAPLLLSVTLTAIPRDTRPLRTWKLAILPGPSLDSKATYGARSFAYCPDHKALGSSGKVGDLNARVQRWREFIIAFDYTLEYRKGSANGNAGFLSRLPEPATDHDRRGSRSLPPVKNGDIFLVRACGLRTRFSLTPDVGLSGLVPCTEGAVSGGLPFTSSAFCYFRAHGPRMRGLTTSAPLGRFVARASPSVATVDYRLCLRFFHPPPTPAFASVFVLPSGGDQAAEAPVVAMIVTQRAPLPTTTLQGEYSAVNTDPAASAPSPPGDRAPLNILPPSDLISTRTRRRTAAAVGTACC